MTNELEKTFFDAFGIEPRKVKICRNINHCPKKYKLCNDDCKHWQVIRIDYPQITDHILLELICILTRWHLDEHEPYEITSINMEQLKNQILGNSFDIAKCVKTKQQVQAIFKSGDNNDR